MTARSTFSPRWASAASFSFVRIWAEISGGDISLPPCITRASPLADRTTL